MKEIEIRPYLLGSPVGVITPRIYNGPLPEGAALPAVTFNYVTDTAVNTMNGDTGYSRKRFEFNAWANTYQQAQELRKAIQSAMSAFNRLSLVPLHEPKDSIYRFAIDYSIFSQED